MSRSGSTVTFWPDTEIFTETTEFDYDIIARRLRELSYLTGVEIHLTDKRGETKAEIFKATGGLADFVKSLSQGRETLHKIIRLQETGDGRDMELALVWNTSFTESIHSFANTINTHEGGMHKEGFRKALTNVVNRYIRAKSLAKEKEPALEGGDIREGMIAILVGEAARPAVRGADQDQAGQLGHALVREDVRSTTSWPSGSRSTRPKASGSSPRPPAGRPRSCRSRESPRHHPQVGVWKGRAPGKLADCASPGAPHSSELFIVEGDSAGGSAKGGRDAHAVVRDADDEPGDDAAAHRGTEDGRGRERQCDIAPLVVAQPDARALEFFARRARRPERHAQDVSPPGRTA